MKRAFLQMNLAVVLWGFSGIFGRAISLSAPVLVWYRLFLAAFILGLMIHFKGQGFGIPPKKRRQVMGIGLLVAIHWLLFYGAIKFANASIAMICLATSSVFIAILDPLIHKGRIKILELGVGGIALLGVLSIYWLRPAHLNERFSNMQLFNLGLAFGVLASILAALFTVLNKPFAEHYPPRSLVFYEMVSGFAFLTLLLPFYLHWVPDETFHPQPLDFLWIFLLGYCCTVWGQSLAMAALKHLSAFTSAITVNLEPVYGIILAFLIFKENEELGRGFYLGMTLIFISVALQVYLSLRKNTHRQRQRVKPPL